MDNKHIKKCSSSLVIQEMQIKTTFRFHLSPVKVATINNTNNNKCQGGCGEKVALPHYWWESKLVQQLWKALWRFLKKLKIELPYNPAIPLLGIYTKECAPRYDGVTCTPMFIAALFTIAKLWHLS
jgi:hypothetical protein